MFCKSTTQKFGKHKENSNEKKVLVWSVPNDNENPYSTEVEVSQLTSHKYLSNKRSGSNAHVPSTTSSIITSSVDQETGIISTRIALSTSKVLVGFNGVKLRKPYRANSRVCCR